MDIFSLDGKQAEQMALLTKGYPFAFQVLGYFYWENCDQKSLEDILPEYDQYLEEYIYIVKSGQKCLSWTKRLFLRWR